MANLWDVTDRDIDRFCQSLLKTWLEEGRGEQSSGESSGNCTASGITSLGDMLGAVAAAGAADGDGEQEGGVGQDRAVRGMSKAVASSREACKLPHLIGAAPVCYGVPVSVSWRGK